MNYKVVDSSKIVWCPGDDRYIVIFESNDEIIGLNYMQGDELDVFKQSFLSVDEELTDFFKDIEPYLIHDDQVDRINAAIWAHFAYTNLRDDRKYNNNNEL